jgi:photosystem II stability/assembly factor-like uncharacterized protein
MNTNLLKHTSHLLFVFLLQCSHNEEHGTSELQKDTLTQQIHTSVETVPSESDTISFQNSTFDSIRIGPDLNDFTPINGSFKKLNNPEGVGRMEFDISDSMLFAKSQGTFFQFNDSTNSWFPVASNLPDTVFKEKEISLGNYLFKRVDVNDSLSGSGHRSSIVRRHVKRTNWTNADSSLLLEKNHCSVHALAGFKGSLYASFVMEDISEYSYCGFFQSSDFGKSWTEVQIEIPEGGLVESFFSTGEVLFAKVAAIGYNVHETFSTSDGSFWKRHSGDELNNSELPSRLISTMAQIGKTCFIFGLDVGGGVHLFKSNDNGYHWKASGKVLKPVFSELHSKGPRLVGYNSIGGIFISSDSGTTWQAINEGLPTERFSSNSVAICDGAILFSTRYLASDLVYNFFRSEDYGNNWSEIPLHDRKDSHIDYIQQVNNVLFVGGREGLFCSSDCGRNWSHTILFESATKVATIGNQLITGTFKGMYASTDNGITWVFAGKTSSGKWEQSLFELVSVDTVLFVNRIGDSCQDHRILESKNKGVSWSPVKSCFPMHINFYSLGHNLLVSADTTIYAYSDSTRKWSLVNTGFLQKGINCFAQYNQNVFIVIGNELLITDMVSHWNKIKLPWDRPTPVLSMSADSANVIISTGVDLWQLSYSE